VKNRFQSSPFKCNLQRYSTVQVEVMHGELELELSVSPIEATVVMHFQTKERWGLDELAREMGVTEAVLRRKAVVWINQGVLVEEKGEAESSYRLTSGEDGKAAFGAAAADDEGGGGGAVASAEDQAAVGLCRLNQVDP
jgi:anaphase-promoting complex subunit 2